MKGQEMKASKKHSSSLQSRYFHSVDMNIHYQAEGDGPPLICLHGGKGNSGDKIQRNQNLGKLTDDGKDD